MHFLGKKQKKTGKQPPFSEAIPGLFLNIQILYCLYSPSSLTIAMLSL